MSLNFEVYQNDKLIFQSPAHWLHPIFEFETFLNANAVVVEALSVRDKIIGRAAALLLVNLGIRRIHAVTLSAMGQDILNHFNIHHSYDQLVEKIGCKTEDLLKNELNPQVAYKLIKDRINKTHSSPSPDHPVRD